MDSAFLALPNDLLLCVAARLSPADKARLQCVSPAAAQCTQDDALWHPHQAAARWHAAAPPMAGPISVQRLYKAMATAEIELYKALKAREGQVLRSISRRRLLPRGGVAVAPFPVHPALRQELAINADAQKQVRQGLRQQGLLEPPQRSFGATLRHVWAWATQCTPVPPLDAAARQTLQRFCDAEGLRMSRPAALPQALAPDDSLVPHSGPCSG